MAAIARDKGIDPHDIELWFADEARIGQKNKITRRWARRGTRPSAPSDQRTASTYIFGAICPSVEGRRPALVRPRCDTEAMNLRYAERRDQSALPAKTPCSGSIKPDGMSSNPLVVPATITFMPLPPKCPELNPVENVWQSHPRELDVEPRLPLLRQPPRPLLRGLEPSHQPTVENHVHRSARLGTQVLVKENWYKRPHPGELQLSM